MQQNYVIYDFIFWLLTAAPKTSDCTHKNCATQGLLPQPLALTPMHKLWSITAAKTHLLHSSADISITSHEPGPPSINIKQGSQNVSTKLMSAAACLMSYHVKIVVKCDCSDTRYQKKRK